MVAEIVDNKHSFRKPIHDCKNTGTFEQVLKIVKFLNIKRTFFGQTAVFLPPPR